MKYCLPILLLFFLSCEKKALEDKNVTYQFTEIKSSNVNSNHVSEGILVTLGNGEIVNFYRFEEGVEGGHIGNNGKIVQRRSLDNGKTWGSEIDVYSDEFDDRNIRGGLIKEDVIILFFRRYDAEIKSSVDLNYIISKDGGTSWSQATRINIDTNIAYEVWIDNITDLGNGKFLLPIHGVSYCEIRFLEYQNDNIIISDPNFKWNYLNQNDFQIDEPVFTFLGDGRIIGLFRDESKAEVSNYFEVYSEDYGLTWTEPKRTNICHPYFSPSPMIFYDNKTDKIIAIGTDRRPPVNGENLSKNSEIWVYEKSLSKEFKNSKGYNLVKKFPRPMPSDFQLYGYPTITKNIQGEYLIIFTESSFDGLNEDADLYQFRLILE